MKFGVRDIANIIFKASTSGQKLGTIVYNKYDPILYFDSGKISTIESSVSTSYAQGGRGNPRILGWDGDKVVTLTFEDALMSPKSFTALSGGNLLLNQNIQLHLTEKALIQDTANNWVRDFNGTNSYVFADNEITAYPFTLETWVKFDSTATLQSFVSIASSAVFSRYWVIEMISQRFRITARNTTAISVSGTTPVVADTWYHLAGVYASATDRRLYLNGVLEASSTASVAFLASSANQVLLGIFRTSSTTNNLDGNLSDVRIWNIGRTPAEISDNYEQRLTGNESGLVGYWKLNQADIIDSTENQNNGTNSGSVQFLNTGNLGLDTNIEISDIPGSVNLLTPADLKIMKLDDGESITQLLSFTTASFTSSTLLVEGLSGNTAPPDTLSIVDFYTQQTGNAIIIQPETFSGYYYIEANTTFLGTDGIERDAMFTIPKGKIKSNFTFNMSSTGDPTVFPFEVDAFPGETRFNSLKKVLFVLEVSSTISGFTSPLGVPSLMAWYDATEISAADSSSVTTWNDKSINGYNATQTTSASRPTYRTNQINGKPALVFDGSNDFLLLSGGALGILRNVAGATVFAVYKASTDLTTQVPIHITTPTSTSRLDLRKSSINKFQVFGRRLDADIVENILSTTTNVGNYIIQSVRVDYQNTLLQQYLNNALDGEKTNFQTSGNTSDTNSGYISIGGYPTGNFLNGAIAEVIVYNRALNDTELFWINAYLKEKYGL